MDRIVAGWDVLYFANGSRPTVKQTLAWYPVNSGLTSFHCSEIAFAFQNVTEPHIKSAAGCGPPALALQD